MRAGLIRPLGVAALLLGAAALGTPAWWSGPLALLFALLPLELAPALGAAALLGGLGWPWGALALLLPGVRPWAFPAFVAAAVLLTGAKQLAVLPTLPAAATVLPGLAGAGLAAVGAARGVGTHRLERLGLALGGLLLLARLGAVWGAEGEARLQRAARLQAEELVYAGLVGRCDEALVRAVPDRDEAALSLGWAAALDAGWRPRKAEGVAVEVALALEARGRGGEALRLLRRHPRTGGVDAWLGLFERTQGEELRWRGAVLGPVLADGLPLAIWMPAEAYAELLFTTRAPARLELEGEGYAYQGPARLRIVVDRRPETWLMDGPGRFDLGVVEPGPHRIQLRFDNDLNGPDGDRGVRLDALRAHAPVAE